MTGRILLHDLAGEPSALLLEADRIAALGVEADAAGATRVASGGLRAVPGFIELQVNGVEDRDFTADPDAMWEVGPRLARHGVTAFLPTVVSSPPRAAEAALEAFSRGPRDAGPTAEPGAVPLGVHLEGPFIAPVRRGAHEARHLRLPDGSEIDRWVANGARMLTLAPELPGALDAIGRVVAGGSVAAVGHTDADADTTARAVDAGARYATHLFNAMPPLHHRNPGAVGALLDDRRVRIGLIADGVHVDPLVLRLTARLAAGRISLVSDAVADRLGDARVATGAAGGRLADGTLAGGLHGLDHAVRTFAAVSGSRDAALHAVTAVPAGLLGLADGRGELRVGGRADVVLLDDQLRVAATIVGGRPAFLTGRVRWP